MRKLLAALTSLLAVTAFGAGSFQPPETWSSASLRFSDQLVGDFDGDGRLDFSPAGVWPDTATSTSFREMMLNRGTSFLRATWSGSNVCGGGCLTGDFNGDGRTDVMSTAPLKVALSLGGSFASAAVWGGTISPAPWVSSVPTAVMTGRFTATTRDDFATLQSNSNTTYPDMLVVFPSNGSSFGSGIATGVPREPEAMLTYSGNTMLSASGDVTGDGLADLVLVSKQSGDAYVMRNLGGAWSFAPALRWATIVTGVQSIVVRKMTNDATADLIATMPTGDVVVYRAAGYSFNSPSSHALGCRAPMVCAFADFTGDSWGDVVSSTLGDGFEVRRWVETVTPRPPFGPFPPVSPLPPLPPLTLPPSFFPPVIGVHAAMVQDGQACGSSPTVFVDPNPTTTRLRVEAIDASGARRLVREWNAPVGGQLSDPFRVADTSVTRTIVSYLATATYTDGNVQTASVPFTAMPSDPWFSPSATLVGSNVNLTLYAMVPSGFIVDDGVAALEIGFWSGDRRVCSRSGSYFTCSIPRTVWNEQHAAGFTSARITARSSPRCMGQPQQVVSPAAWLTGLPAFPVSGGGTGGGGGTTPPPSVPNLVLTVPRHDGFTADWTVCNMGTAAVPMSATGVGFTYRSDGWMSAMRLDATLMVRGLAVGSCSYGAAVGIGLTPGAGGGSWLPASSVRFCIDDTNVVNEGTFANELDNCIDVGRK